MITNIISFQAQQHKAEAIFKTNVSHIFSSLHVKQIKIIIRDRKINDLPLFPLEINEELKVFEKKKLHRSESSLKYFLC